MAWLNSGDNPAGLVARPSSSESAQVGYKWANGTVPKRLPLLVTTTATASKSPLNTSTDHSQALSSTIQIPSNPQAARQPLKELSFKATYRLPMHSESMHLRSIGHVT